MKTEAEKIIRKELLQIAKERGYEVNTHWTTKYLANFVTRLVLEAHATKNLRAWQKRRQFYGTFGMKKVTGAEKGVERTWIWANQMFAHPFNTGAAPMVK